MTALGEQIEWRMLAGLLSPSVGDAVAQNAVRSALVSLGLRESARLSVSDALAVLERVAETPGLLGVAARFAKSRVHLMV